ncbi:hypothetical protein DOJK_01233 [Patescibacteria group bacterium]|nr:YraN family protein [Candidatus Dojkabacteria bacterium]CAG1021773.1 hypothetical protein DOJK_01233 [Patescibacteria group bacterium]
MDTRSKGRKAEEMAKEFLLKKGYKFVGKNSFFKAGEIDLIMKDGDFIVFIEVKSLRFSQDRDIYSTLTITKKRRLLRSINSWLYKNNLQNSLWRFDFVGIVDIGNGFKIEHFEFVSLAV